MPRSPIVVARQNLTKAIATEKSLETARKRSREKLNETMVAAVQAGLTRGEVARMVGVSMTRVSQIPGMPAGKNVHKDK